MIVRISLVNSSDYISELEDCLRGQTVLSVKEGATLLAGGRRWYRRAGLWSAAAAAGGLVPVVTGMLPPSLQGHVQAILHDHVLFFSRQQSNTYEYESSLRILEPQGRAQTP